MKKFKILIPVYNDWESLEKLLNELDKIIQNLKGVEFSVLIIDDASTVENNIFKVPQNFKSIKIIKMKLNQGHARCIAFGIKYLSVNDDFDYTILMDGDGEDRPEEITSLVQMALKHQSKSVVARRIKRSEGVIFRSMYEIHKLITFIFTGKKINFGNYSCLTKKDLKLLSDKKSLWSSFSGSVSKHLNEISSINSIRGIRYFGPSKMSLYKLIIHSFSIIAVFKEKVFLRSIMLIIFLSFLNFEFNNILFPIIQIFFVIFCLVIFVVSRRENLSALNNSPQNQKQISIHTP